ncbi:hypothetical protein NXH76_25975 [Blautia schinkii]|nr:hypothetical protein [Blautia schinkii]
MKKLKQMFGKNPMAWLFLILLLISVAGNVVQQTYIQEHSPKMLRVVGTYNNDYSDAPIPGTEYLVFESERDGVKNYVHYIQGQLLGKGEYNDESEEIVSLKSDSGENSGWIIKRLGEVYWIHADGDVVPFKKIADLPTYINVDHEAIDSI